MIVFLSIHAYIHNLTIFYLIQFKFVCIALFMIQIVAKQL